MAGRKEELDRSNDMEPVHGTVDVAIPIEVLWQSFTHANWWPRWNACFFWVKNRNLIAGHQLIWVFQPIKWWYLYKMPAIAKIIEAKENEKVTWEVVAFPGMYAQHTYSVEDLGNGRSRFGSWEKAMGPGFRLFKWFWVPHFVFVKDKSLEGARTLEQAYVKSGRLDGQAIQRKSYVGFFISALLALLLLTGAALAVWMYESYLKIEAVELAPGAYAVLNGGCNSLVVQDGSDVLVVDTKFPPGSKWFHDWLSKTIRAPVKAIVNTHYHFDHTEGNVEYPGAPIFANVNAPALMLGRDSSYWSRHMDALPGPDNLVATSKTLRIGSQDVLLEHPADAHTHTDLYVHLSRGGKEIVATGDLVFHGYYPFFDLSAGGSDIQGIISIVRSLAARYPNAVFVPGHGSLATAGDLNHYADYLESLDADVARERAGGATESQAVERINLDRWHLAVLPIFHYGQGWSTAASNVRAVYELKARTVSPYYSNSPTAHQQTPEQQVAK